ncbi:hypothetical protein JK386_00410 [Nocardioides sp. zg-536]|uniref:Uncharacterized protein n=1 Tax=Nocardioides faecalis TaxID=2803858 RepID=A0A938Y348_9ACTN|nr:hypothetical protein [Nocardioides faecalis]MBM9458360.1 hypothetical protein [Nocardioides faecalis]QVI58382.1 hypothetical protein KG111_15490 [Nocardioides faecalis]
MSLLALGAFLVIVGLCDLLRATRDRVSATRRTVLIGIGWLLVLIFLLWTGDSLGGALLLGLGMGLGLTLWVIGSSAALVAHALEAPVWRALAFGGLGLGAAASLLGAGALEEWVLWPGWLRDTVFATWPVADVTVSAGAVLLQLATGNLLVRLVLDAVGVPAITNEKKLKGGRLLGPMERIFIVGLGHIGEVTAAAIVVAAKGLLRFPDLQAGAKEGPSDLSEYFLVGSFASWLIGLAGVALIYVA